MNRIYHKIFSYKNIKPEKISLAYFKIKPNNLTNNSNISNKLKKEIEIRMAQRVINLSTFPNHLREYKEIVDVKNLYVKSFAKIYNYPRIKNIEECYSFGDLLGNIKEEHKYIPIEISKAVQEYKKISEEPSETLNLVLDKFYSSRIGIRTIIDYYNFLFSKNPEKNYLKCNVNHVLQTAADDARFASIQYYRDHSRVPQIKINISDEINILYRPSNLYFMSFEIIKNGIRAMVEDRKYKNIEIDVINTDENIIIIFRDFASSVKHNEVNTLFDYSFTSVNDDDLYKREILAGFGHGLPLSRLYARFFGGDLIFVPYYGIKSEVILYLNKDVSKSTYRL